MPALISWIGQKIHRVLFGWPPPRCGELKEGESCHKHHTVSDSAKLLLASMGSFLTIFYMWWFSGLQDKYETAQKEAGAGIYIILAFVFLLSVMWTTHQKFVHTGTYIFAGIAAPTAVFVALMPLVR